MEQAVEGNWFFKSNEDGIFVKVNDQRIKNRSGNLMEEVIDVKECGGSSKNTQNIAVTFKDSVSHSGKCELKLSISSFVADKNDFCRKFAQINKTKDFVVKLKTALKQAIPSTSVAAAEISEDERGPPIQVTPTKTSKSARGRKRKTAAQLPLEGVELTSPEKVPKANHVDEEIETHYLGLFNLKVSRLKECRTKWLDRKLDESRVEEIKKSIESSPASMHNAQPWLAIADVTKEQIRDNKNLVKGAKLEVIGGLHRRAAYMKLSMASETNQKLLDKVWVSVYDSGLTDEQVCRLAAKHNLDNQGSKQTKWFDRVVACRQWLYQLAKANVDKDETPESSTVWKKACQSMYTTTGKDVNSLEPTLQAALLPRTTFDLLLELSKQYENGQLKGMKPQKPSRRKSLQLTQNQVGMPIQGLEKAAKDDLLTKVLNKQYSLKEMKEAAEGIKRKKNVVRAFLKFTGEDDWQSLQKRFPHHATEQKLAQFKDVPVKKGQTPPVLESFFRRALAWEKEESVRGLNVVEEKDGVFFFTNNIQDKVEVGILMTEEEKALPYLKIKGMAPGFKGFHLAILRLNEGAEENELRTLLLSLHAGNIDNLERYNVVIVNPGRVVDGITDKFTCIQRAYWYDTRKKKSPNHLLQNSLRDIAILNWAANNTIGPECCNLGDDASNVFAFPATDDDQELLPVDLTSTLIQKLSFEGQWILDLSQSKGAGIIAGLSANRNVVCIEGKEDLRSTASYINLTLTEKPQEVAEEEEQPTSRA